MKLFLIILTIFIFLVIYLVIRRKRREADDSGISVKGNPNFDDMVLCVAESCRNVICGLFLSYITVLSSLFNKLIPPHHFHIITIAHAVIVFSSANYL